jgi:hypothetical protein
VGRLMSPAPPYAFLMECASGVEDKLTEVP